MDDIVKLYGRTSKINFIKLNDLNLLRPLNIEGLRELVIGISDDEFDSIYLHTAISVLSKKLIMPTEYIAELILDLINYENQEETVDCSSLSKTLIRDMTNNLHDIIHYLNDKGWNNGKTLISWHVKIEDNKMFAYIATYEDCSDVKDK